MNRANVGAVGEFKRQPGPPVLVFSLASPHFYQSHYRRPAPLWSCKLFSPGTHKQQTHPGEPASRGEGGSGNQTLHATQRSRTSNRIMPLGVWSQEHRSPTGTRRRWHPANISQVTADAALFLGQVATRWSSSATLHSAWATGNVPVAVVLLLTICSPSLPQVAHLAPPTHDSPHDDPSMSCHIQLEMQGASSMTPAP